ncbi:MAG: hypothetical protein JSS86_10810 [Cyanobacteria bacterium SZAS LIN-2]|nr:hypothetical protein [Cyanobacteria bacterium SZAS LIN-2]
MRQRNRSTRGTTLSEAVMSLATLTPVLLAVTLVVIEASKVYSIEASMKNGANLAAASLANYYHTNPGVVTDPDAQQQVFNNIRISQMIASNSQFSIPAGGWNLTANPPRVTVLCTYLPGQGSPALPAFPTIDPLKLGSRFTISESATYALKQ